MKYEWRRLLSTNLMSLGDHPLLEYKTNRKRQIKLKKSKQKNVK